MAITFPAFTHPLLKRLITHSLEAVEAGAAVTRAVRRQGNILTIDSRRYDLRRFERVVVVGAGKATASMARAIEQVLGKQLERGLVIVKYGHSVSTKRIIVEEAGHPLPDRAGLYAARRLQLLVSSLTHRDLLIVLFSGGASSLLPAPVPGVTLREKQVVTDQLLRSGANIHEINSVRKHLSTIKGGRLAGSTSARIVTLVLSDVVGDDMSAIASGPTVPDPTTFGEAVECLKRYRLWSGVPSRIQRHLERGRRGLEPETPKPGAALFRRTQYVIVGNNECALTAAGNTARTAGLNIFMYPVRLVGEASLAGVRFGEMATRIVRHKESVGRPCCVIAGGETIVSVQGRGKGGRAQEFALASAKPIAGLKNVWVTAIGTDGTDGPTDVAGAVVNGETLDRARRLGIDLNAALRQNNTYPALKKLGAHIITGPTNTNVNDLYLLLVL